MSIDPRIKAAMKKANKAAGHDVVILGSEIAQPLRPTITTGSLNLDAAIGGGWACGHWAEIVGHESTGKTYLVLKTIAANQALNPDFTTIWFATEDFSQDYARLLGVNLDQVVVFNENVMEVVFQQAIDFIKTKGVDLMVVDSLPYLVSEREDEGTMEDHQPGVAAILTGKFFRISQKHIKRDLSDADERLCTGICINGWRSKIGSRGDPRVTPGGVGKNFVFYQRVDVSRSEWITNTKDEPVGQVMRVKNIKNKIARPGLIGMVDAYVAPYRGHPAGEFDTLKDIVSAAFAYGVLEKRGKDTLNIYFGDQKWAGRPKLEEALQGDPKLVDAIREAVLASAAAPVPDEPEEDEGDD